MGSGAVGLILFWWLGGILFSFRETRYLRQMSRFGPVEKRLIFDPIIHSVVVEYEQKGQSMIMDEKWSMEILQGVIFGGLIIYLNIIDYLHKI